MWWTNYIVNYIRNVLDWMGRRSGFGWQDVDGLWRDNLGELHHMKRGMVQERILRDCIGGGIFCCDRARW